jgi:apolipoprotein N-acyltransferase
MADQATRVRQRAKDVPASPRTEPDQSPAPAAVPPPVGVRPHLALPALATAGLLWLCYFPVAWGWLGWVALVPLLALVRADASPRRIKLCAWLAGLAFFWPILQWMRVADYRMYYTWAMLATYCALYFPVAIVLLRRLDRGTSLPLIVTLPAVWVGLEFVRSWLLTGFAWYYLGHTQHDYLAMIQVCDLGGVYVVSLLVAAVNAWLFEVLYGWKRVRDLLGLPGGAKPASWTPPRLLAIQGAIVGSLVVAALIYGACRLSEEPFTRGPRLAMLQGNLDQRLRNTNLAARDAESRKAQATIYQHYGDLELVARTKLDPWDLIVWPETSFPEVWQAAAPGVSLDRVPNWRNEMIWKIDFMRRYAPGDIKRLHPITRQLINPPPANLLLGLNTEVLVQPDGRTHKYSSALLVHANGVLGERYDKIHRVPFGEYVPFRDWFPWMDSFAPYDNDYSIRAGEHLTRLKLYQQDGRGSFVAGPDGQPVVAYRFGVLICFEDTDPFLARPYGVTTADGPPVDFLVNISNDGWFDGSSEHDEHLAISRFRAIEARRSIARAVNMGISAVIDGNGRVLRPILTTNKKSPVWELPFHGAQGPDLPVSEWADFKKTWGVLIADIPIDQRTTLYSLWGDWLPAACWVVVGVGLVWAIVQRRRRRALAGAGGVA